MNLWGQDLSFDTELDMFKIIKSQTFMFQKEPQSLLLKSDAQNFRNWANFRRQKSPNFGDLRPLNEPKRLLEIYWRRKSPKRGDFRRRKSPTFGDFRPLNEPKRLLVISGAGNLQKEFTDPLWWECMWKILCFEKSLTNFMYSMFINIFVSFSCYIHNS